ncbi:MAG: hypothetical protein J0M34_08350 [Alphaproteobacteria bacterium]|nr:hypothetical protein [Alphaproteobacteria bacterium]
MRLAVSELPESPTPEQTSIERLPLEKRPMCIQAVVDAIGSPDITYPKLQRAVKDGLVKFSTLQNGRKLVRICDVFKAMGIEE